MMAMKRLVVLGLLVLAGGAACGDDTTQVAERRLLADLDAVVEQGSVQPVNGITAAGQPNEAALKVFAEQGYAAVIDLRTAGENRGMDEPAVVESLGMQYVSLPISASDITMESARELAQLMSAHDAPVLVHCASSNRVGALLALIEVDKGADPEAAIEFGRSAGLTSLESAVRKAVDAL